MLYMPFLTRKFWCKIDIFEVFPLKMRFLEDFLTYLAGFCQISPKKSFGFVLIYQIVMSNNYFYYKSDKFQHILLIFWMLSYVKMGFFVFFLQ